MKRRTTLIALVSSLAVLLTVLLTGCGAAAYSDTVTPDVQKHEVQSDLSQSNLTDPATAAPQVSPYITLEKAKEIALNHAAVNAADARWDDREFDFENGQPIYDLAFDANGLEYEYDIDARAGNILRSHSERDDDRSAAAAPTTQNTQPTKPAASGNDYIGLAKAKSIALQRAGVSAASVRWEKAEFDYDDGRPVYELEFSANGVEYDCDVHAVSGKVLDYDAERHDHDDHDHDHDDHDHDNRWDD